MRARADCLLLALVGALVSLAISGSASAVAIDWVLVGDPGNAADTEVMDDSTTGYGAVGYAYLISKYEVTNAQYAEFLNAVADTDAYGVYHAEMGSDGGITRSGASGSYAYAVLADSENLPVNYVSWFDTLRFANWLHNGQPNTGAQTMATTENGAYTFGTTFIELGVPAPPDPEHDVTSRNANAAVFIPTEHEWYKAAYYDPQSGSYFDYPAGFDAQTTCTAPTATLNSANCQQIGVPSASRPVGSYSGSASPYGTFDQGGNVWELTAVADPQSNSARGGAADFAAGSLAASHRPGSNSGVQPEIGFRVGAAVPEPGTGSLLALGLLGLAGARQRVSPRERRAPDSSSRAAS